MHGLEPDLGIWPSATTGGTCCLLLNPDQTNSPISKEELEEERRDQTNTAQLLNQKIKHWPSDHQGQPWSPASPRILTPLLLPHCPIHSSSATGSVLVVPLGTYKSKTKPVEGFSLSSRPPQLLVAPSLRREHINREADPSFHPHFCCFCWSCWGGLDTFDWLDTF